MFSKNIKSNLIKVLLIAQEENVPVWCHKGHSIAAWMTKTLSWVSPFGRFVFVRLQTRGRSDKASVSAAGCKHRANYTVCYAQHPQVVLWCRHMRPSSQCRPPLRILSTILISRSSPALGAALQQQQQTSNDRLNNNFTAQHPRLVCCREILNFL